MSSDARTGFRPRPGSGTSTAASDAPLRGGPAPSLLPNPSPRLVGAFRAAATRMAGLPFVNPALDIEAVGFAPWQGHWLGVMLTPWFMNLILAPRDVAAWQPSLQGEKRCYRFPAGVYEFIGAQDDVVGEYQLCSLFSPVLQFEDQATARLVAQLARDALFDVENAEKPEMPAADLSPGPGPDPAAAGPLASLEAQLDAPQSKRDFLRGRWAGDDRGNRR
jgi:[NiFe] hydrogenase assembly HybE family chaperone